VNGTFNKGIHYMQEKKQQSLPPTATGIFRATLFFSFFFIHTTVFAGLIKTGDMLSIQVIDHPEFSGRYLVGEDGTIEYPLLADEIVSDINTSELMNHLTFKLAKHIDNPLVLVSIDKTPQIRITVLGQVLEPGTVSVYEGASLQEVISSAGGSLPAADLSSVKVIPGANREGNPRVYNLARFLREGDIGTLPILYHQDIVVVLKKEHTSKVKVIGGVKTPGFYELEGKLNLFEIIYMAGGPLEKADLSRVRRYTRINEQTTEEIIDIQGYLDRGEMEKIPEAQEGDLVIVYTKWFDWKTVLSILNNTLLFIVTIQAFSGVFNN